MKATLKNFHQSPRKVRLVADMIRGKNVVQARAALSFLPQKSTPAIAKLLDSAVANARESGVSVEALFVKSIAVNKGAMMRRARPFARGRSGSIRKTMSIVTLELGANATPKKTRAKKAVKAEAK
jgi:large subunit ribosomal protein L22